MTNFTKSQALAGCGVLPALRPAQRPRQTPAGSIEHSSQNRKGRVASRFTELNTFVDQMLGGLKTRNELAVWIILFRDARDGMANVSQAYIARRAGISDRTVRRAIGRLVKQGLVEVVWRGGLGRSLSRYRVRPLPFPKP